MNTHTWRTTLVVPLIALTVLAGCASQRSGVVYSRDQVQSAQEVDLGRIISLKPVTIEGTKSQIGTLAGTAIGGIAGAGSSDGTTGQILGILGGVAGGIAGASAEEAMTRKQAVEITVTLESGQTYSIVQEDDQALQVNEQVKVLSNPDGSKRVTKL